MLNKNQLIEVTVDAMSHEGSGIARYEGMAVFVPMAAIGDRLLVRVVKVLKSYAYGIIEQLLEPSEHRVENDCPVYHRCGGCSLRHISYGHEMDVKAGWVTDNLRRIGGVTPQIDPPIPSPRSARYRNKAQFPVQLVDGKIRTGFFARRSHALIPVEGCLLQPAYFSEICRTVVSYMEIYGVSAYDERSHTGLVRHIFIRCAEATGQVMVCLVINGDDIPRPDQLVQSLTAVCPQISTVVLSHNTKRTNVVTGNRLTPLLGEGVIQDTLCDVGVRLSPLSFYQVNREGAQLLYKAALDYAAPTPDDVLLDLYCGAGTIGLSMAHQVRQVIGVEIVQAAVEDAKTNAKQAGIQNARFLAADAAGAARQLAEEGVRPHIVILDPPRKGAEEAVLQTVAQMGPGKIIYISCNSATLARDCEILGGLGYGTKQARAVDLFPRTAHVEAVTLLERKGE